MQIVFFLQKHNIFAGLQQKLLLFVLNATCTGHRPENSKHSWSIGLLRIRIENSSKTHRFCSNKITKITSKNRQVRKSVCCKIVKWQHIWNDENKEKKERLKCENAGILARNPKDSVYIRQRYMASAVTPVNTTIYVSISTYNSKATPNLNIET